MRRAKPNTFYRRGAWLAGVCLLGSSLALAGATRHPLPRYGVAVYSDLCLEADTGDVGGQRISVHRYADMDSLFYEYTAGTLSLPVVASDVDINDRTGVLTFSVIGQDGRERTLFGRFGDRGQSLTLEGGYCADGSKAMRLSRVNDFSRPLQACKACPRGQERPLPSAAPSLPTVVAEPVEASGRTLEQEELVQRAAPATIVRPVDGNGSRRH